MHHLSQRPVFVGVTLASLNPKQQIFVSAYIGAAKHSATEAARLAGYKQPGMHGSRLMKNDDIQTAIAEHLAEVKARGIADKQNRIDELVERHKTLKQVVIERAASEWLADVPGGSTGYVVKQLKRVKHVFLPDLDDEDGKASVEVEDLWESTVDTGLLRELRDHEKQVAQEMGEWTEKSEVLNTGSMRLEIAGMRVPLPASSGDGE